MGDQQYDAHQQHDPVERLARDVGWFRRKTGTAVTAGAGFALGVLVTAGGFGSQAITAEHTEAPSACQATGS